MVAVAALIEPLPLAPVPRSNDAIASPLVVLAWAATGPDVNPRVKLKVGVLKLIELSLANSEIQPNFKLCDPRSLVMFNCRLCVSAHGIGVSTIVQSCVVLHLELGVRFRLKLRNERGTEAERGRIQTL